jgi:ribonuclease J
MSKEKLRILPLGGLGEIGMNCMVLEWGEDMVLVDCGIQFPNVSYPGVDLLAPDFSYVRQKGDNLRGIVITHGHDDHIGAIPFLAMDLELDVYCTPFPRGLVRHKLMEYPTTREVRFHDIEPRKPFRLGPFTFDPIRVQHSIIESVAFAIDTPVGTVLHTGDFKHDPKEVGGDILTFEPFAELGDRGVHLLLSDSTNAERAGHTLSELDIANSFEQIFASQNGRILIALFASNIRRIENLLWMAHRQGKKVAFAGRSMHAYTRLAHEQGTMRLPEETLVLLESTNQYADDRVIVLLTGSQAEPQSALVRIAQGTHKDFQIRNGDRVILSSRFIPGNERAITSMIDHLYRLGADVTYEAIHQIHVSGHGFQEELLMMLDAARPRFFVPIHGEYRHMAKHAKLARQAGVEAQNIAIVENGQVLEIDRESIRLGEKLELQKAVIVGGSFMDGTPSTFTQRNNLSKTGIVFTTLLCDARKGKLLARPTVNFHGLLFREEVSPETTKSEAEEFLEDLYPEIARRSDWDEVLKLELRRFFKKRVSHKPVVIPVMLEI